MAASRRGLRRTEPAKPSAALAAKVIDDRTFEVRGGLPIGTSNPASMAPAVDEAVGGRTVKGGALPAEHKLVFKR